jgi:hypothetical protein
MLMPFFIPRERITRANGIQTTIRISRKMANIKGGKPEERDLWNLDKAGIGEQKQAEEPAEAEAEAEVDEKAEIDSIDSLICASDFPMLMTFTPRSRGSFMRIQGDCESVLNQDDRGRWKKTELAVKQRDSQS